MTERNTTEELLNEINFYPALKLSDGLKEPGLINEMEYTKTKEKLIETYQPYLGELMG